MTTLAELQRVAALLKPHECRSANGHYWFIANSDWYCRVAHPDPMSGFKAIRQPGMWHDAYRLWRQDGKPVMTAPQIWDKYQYKLPASMPGELGSIESVRFISSRPELSEAVDSLTLLLRLEERMNSEVKLPGVPMGGYKVMASGCEINIRLPAGYVAHIEPAAVPPPERRTATGQRRGRNRGYAEPGLGIINRRSGGLLGIQPGPWGRRVGDQAAHKDRRVMPGSPTTGPNLRRADIWQPNISTRHRWCYPLRRKSDERRHAPFIRRFANLAIIPCSAFNPLGQEQRRLWTRRKTDERREGIITHPTSFRYRMSMSTRRKTDERRDTNYPGRSYSSSRDPRVRALERRNIAKMKKAEIERGSHTYESVLNVMDAAASPDAGAMHGVIRKNRRINKVDRRQIRTGLAFALGARRDGLRDRRQS